jgi:DNA-binding MarR family transcriptional regulator
MSMVSPRCAGRVGFALHEPALSAGGRSAVRELEILTEDFGNATEGLISPLSFPAGMTVLLGTLGFTPKKFLGVLKTLPDVERAVVYTAATERTKDRERVDQAWKEVERTLKSLDIPAERVVLEDPFDFAAFLERFLKDVKVIGPENAVLNLTGGSKPMAVAATVACLVLGVRAVYVPEEQERAKPIDLPIFRIRYSSVLSPKEHRVLETIRDTEPPTLTALASELKILPSTLSGHLRKLELLGAVRLLPIPRQGQARRPELTEAGDLLLRVEQLAASRHAG